MQYVTTLSSFVIPASSNIFVISALLFNIPDALKEAGIETAKGGSEPKAVDVKIDSIDTTHVINTDELKANYDDYKVVDVRASKPPSTIFTSL